MSSKKILMLLCIFAFLSCTQSSNVINEVFELPKKISESSALEMTPNSDWIWTLEDSGNDANLFAMDAKGKIVNTLSITDTANNDWEALASDEQGNLYIGDFGNNDNQRKDLCIYKINASDLSKKEATTAQKIEFYYPEQTDFPPKKANLFYDSEAFFFYNDNFYLFTKNRSSKFDGTTLLYRVPNREGRHAATLLGSFKACDTYKQCAITAADISADGTKMVLLSATKVWLFENFKGNDFFNGNVREIALDHFSQKEGICFVNNTTVYISDEKDKKSGGKLYELKL